MTLVVAKSINMGGAPRMLVANLLTLRIVGVCFPCLCRSLIPKSHGEQSSQLISFTLLPVCTTPSTLESRSSEPGTCYPVVSFRIRVDHRDCQFPVPGSVSGSRNHTLSRVRAFCSLSSSHAFSAHQSHLYLTPSVRSRAQPLKTRPAKALFIPTCWIIALHRSFDRSD